MPPWRGSNSIKAEAVPRTQPPETRLPSPQVLVSRLRSLRDVLVEKVAALDAAEAVLGDATERRLAALAKAALPGSGPGYRRRSTGP